MRCKKITRRAFYVGDAGEDRRLTVGCWTLWFIIGSNERNDPKLPDIFVKPRPSGRYNSRIKLGWNPEQSTANRSAQSRTVHIHRHSFDVGGGAERGWKTSTEGTHPKQMEDNIDRCGVSRHVESNQKTTAIYLLSKGTVHAFDGDDVR